MGDEIPVVGDVCQTTDGAAGTLQDDGSGTNTLVCVANPPPPPPSEETPAAPAAQESSEPKQGDLCVCPDNIRNGVLMPYGANDALVCVPFAVQPDGGN